MLFKLATEGDMYKEQILARKIKWVGKRNKIKLLSVYRYNDILDCIPSHAKKSIDDNLS